MNDGKALINSKEFWLNVVSFAVEAAMYFEATFPAGKYLPYVVAVHGLGNIFLRVFFTKQPITSIF